MEYQNEPDTTLRKIIAKEAYRDLEVFFCEIDSFEEIPLISRDSRLAKLQKCSNRTTHLNSY